MQAQFIGAIQILVYAGAIVILLAGLYGLRVRQAVAAVQPAKAADDKTISPPLFTESEAPVYFPDQPADPAPPPFVAEPITSEPRVIRPNAPSPTRKLVILDPVRVRMLALIDYVIAVEKDKFEACHRHC
ncbi:MAG: NADH-quinone oxidoreductase subunit J [Sphingomonadales bacterium]|nr:NADH-quinone oxidoreductase subunit J [Sphingomonadales bacterium]